MFKKPLNIYKDILHLYRRRIALFCSAFLDISPVHRIISQTEYKFSYWETARIEI